jgi:hypothetical protein
VDDIAFDRFTRLFSSTQPRRDALRIALGFVLGRVLIGGSPHALADDNDGELADEAIAGGRGALDDVGGRSGGKRRRSNKKRGKDGGGNENRKRERQDKCAKAGRLRKDGKPCCKGLYRDSADRCIKHQSAEGSAESCDPLACPSDPSTGQRGVCCPGGFCSCGGVCCAGPDCWIYARNNNPNPVDSVQIQVIGQELCAPPADCPVCPASEFCCPVGCNTDGTCVEGEQGPQRGSATIRRRP